MICCKPRQQRMFYPQKVFLIWLQMKPLLTFGPHLVCTTRAMTLAGYGCRRMSHVGLSRQKLSPCLQYLFQIWLHNTALNWSIFIQYLILIHKCVFLTINHLHVGYLLALLLMFHETNFARKISFRFVA